MTATPLPLPRETRESAILVGNGTAGPYGPSAYKIFDTADVTVWSKAAAATVYTDVTASCTIAKVNPANAYDYFTVTFGANVPNTTSWYHQARRTAERSVAVTKGGTLIAAELEKELSKQASAGSELRRDIDRAVRVNAGEDPVTIVPGADGTLAKFEGGNLVEGPNADDIADDAAAAQAARDAARKWATEAEDVGVNDGVNPAGFSAFHWMRKALASATSAAGSAAAAAASAIAAAASAASLNLPPVVANTFLQANGAGTGYVTKTAPDVRDALDTPVYVADRTAMKALVPTKDLVVIMYNEGGRNGTFIVKAGAQPVADASEGIFVASNTAGFYLARLDAFTNQDIDPQWFGAVPYTNGVQNTAVDCRAALLAAISVGKSLYLAARIKFPPGFFRISAGITILSNSVSIVGAGMDLTNLVWDAAATSYLTFGDAPTSAAVFYNAVEDMTLDRDGNTVPNFSTGILLSLFNYFKEKNVRVGKAGYPRYITGKSAGISVGYEAYSPMTRNTRNVDWLIEHVAGVKVFGGEVGQNGSELYDRTEACIRIFGNANDVVFVGLNALPRGPRTVDPAFCNFAGLINATGVFHFINCNTEATSVSFASDASTPIINELIVLGGRYASALTAFNLNAATQLIHSTLGGGVQFGIGLTLINPQALRLVGAEFLSLNLVGGASASATVTGCVIEGAYSDSGNWPASGGVAFGGGLTLAGNTYNGSYIGTATGLVQRNRPDHQSILSADLLKADVATVQNVFDVAQDEFTVEASTTYEFEALYMISRAAGVTSHTFATLFGGTATLTSIDYLAEVANPTGNVLANQQSLHVTAATAAVLTAANTSATEYIMAKLTGTIRTNTAGTIIPQFQLSAAAGGAPTVKRNSFFKMRAIGNSAMVAQGALS